MKRIKHYPIAKALRHFKVKIVRSRKAYNRKLDKLVIPKTYKDDIE